MTDEIEKIVEKVWGREYWIVNRAYYGKILELSEGGQCSIHYHKDKDETFYILEGKVLMEYEDKRRIMLPGHIQHIAPYTSHRFTGLENSKMIEFSTHHSEEDSIRDQNNLSKKINLSDIDLDEEKQK